eukprot:CAMPEP_0113946172 /NCGR_PEP_ID=MMETSP1339-20121228/55104_1 /TAXON_ID=94617 /ORGANISM="Fibrocapsa japonica" /LENGTH=107 /DNA_ID=CAMNT_0000952127 /DNA_START=207 /DNA_END=527 /DNA_ORIENTATION=+ /assembly_acc=CAM_ASM_000762
MIEAGSTPLTREELAGNKRRYSDEDEESIGGTSSSLWENVFFLVLMMLASLFGAMLFTNWMDYSSSGDSEWEEEASFWIKAISQWFLLIFQARVLYVSYSENSDQYW